MFATDVIDVANELNIPSYIYYPSTATSLSLSSHLSCQERENDQKDSSEMEDIHVPGLIPIPSTCLPNHFLYRNSASYKWIMHHGRRCNEAKAVIVNSNIYLEKAAVETLAEGTLHAPDMKLPDIYPIGPVVSLGKNISRDHECLNWLDMQPKKSVVFLCFGSIGAFDMSQIRQIASALEQSGHRFLWAIRTPSKELLR
ncbi:hypothetical protein LUZ63_004075 [Rhynchospora breviuscula]|uniref:Uncharacterized protein n=1 Tax=Rhynchospora breviuscula TaxID=2022672 RepID=A0A9Q0D1T5_9POAL|nr:hypothetical protein LUZ63_004075 [Rhynchospora breviuscula]